MGFIAISIIFRPFCAQEYRALSRHASGILALEMKGLSEI
jgi:hypothetical protein